MSAPLPEDVQRLHAALAEGSPEATCDFAQALLPGLIAWLQAENAGVSPDLCESAALEAMYDFLREPTKYDTGRGQSLPGYLRAAARRDLLNLLARERRHRHLPLDENVELDRPGRKEEEEPWQQLAAAEDDAESERQRRALFAGLSAEDAALLELLLAGERATSRFAEVLGVGHLPAEEQTAAVKRAKDRLKIRLKRGKDGA